MPGPHSAAGQSLGLFVAIRSFCQMAQPVLLPLPYVQNRFVIFLKVQGGSYYLYTICRPSWNSKASETKDRPDDGRLTAVDQLIRVPFLAEMLGAILWERISSMASVSRDLLKCRANRHIGGLDMSREASPLPHEPRHIHTSTDQRSGMSGELDQDRWSRRFGLMVELLSTPHQWRCKARPSQTTWRSSATISSTTAERRQRRRFSDRRRSYEYLRKLTG
jgi:hypothetical protein